MVQFENQVHKLYSGTAHQQLTDLCEKTYNPNGGTALNDAVMEAIEDVETRLKKSNTKDKPQVIIIVFTDGEENASKRYSKAQVSTKRSEKEQEGWAFIFMGADMDAWSAGSSYGMSAGNTVSMGKSAQAMAASGSYLSNRTKKAAVIGARFASGQIAPAAYANSMMNFMSLDAEDLATDQVAGRIACDS